MLRIVQVLTGGQEVTGWTIQKARELLAYVIARGGTRVPRGEAAEALWPDEPPKRVAHLLNNAASYLRRTLKAANPSASRQLLTVSEQCYQLLPGASGLTSTPSTRTSDAPRRYKAPTHSLRYSTAHWPSTKGTSSAASHTNGPTPTGATTNAASERQPTKPAAWRLLSAGT